MLSRHPPFDFNKSIIYRPVMMKERRKGEEAFVDYYHTPSHWRGTDTHQATGGVLIHTKPLEGY
jgi:hypothetical protein